MKKAGVLRYVNYFIAFIMLVSIVVFSFSYINKSKQIPEDTMNEFLHGSFAEKKAELKSTFDTMYQSARTISLLPSVRSIEGGNRTVDTEDVVKLGRFSEDALMTVQQIYNNLANNVSVSEIYIITEGLDYKSGEVPFIMLDQLIVQKPKEEAGEEDSAVDPDFPEEYEDDEYAYFPIQMQTLKNQHPSFDFTELNEIPVEASISLRTCDNTQFYSASKHDVKDAFGIFYSVPFYTNDGDYKGIISVIIRNNVFEAMLMDVPFVIITENDVAEAKTLGVEMPDAPVGFYLTNKTYGLQIYDRRNTLLPEKFGNSQYADRIITEPLDITGDWDLGFYFDESMFSAKLADALRAFILQILVVLLFGTALILLLTYSQRSQAKIIDSFAHSIKKVADGDLHSSIESKGKEFSILSNEYTNFTSKMQGTIGEIKRAADTVSENCSGIEGSLDVLTNSSKNLLSSTETVVTQVELLNQMNTEITATLDNVQSKVSDADKNANISSDKIKSVVNSMDTIQAKVGKTAEASKLLEQEAFKVSQLISQIDEIAMQTNILSLNASVEASRASVAGVGFKIVASEMKTLADKTSETVKIISTAIDNIRMQVVATTSLMVETDSQVKSGVALSQEAAESIYLITRLASELRTATTEIMQASKIQIESVNSIEHSGRKVSENVRINDDAIEEVSSIARSLSVLSKTLKDAVGVFQV